MHCRSTSPKETRRFAAEVATVIKPGTVLALIGALGNGKTEFVRGFVAALSKEAGVCSPSFTLVNTYQTGACEVHHFDFFRLNSRDELLEIGYYEYVNDPDAIVLIEWADRFPEVLPHHTRTIRFSLDNDETVRIIDVEKER